MIAPGVHLGPYEIVARIGAGGMGEVWRGRDHRLNRDVAIKVLPEGRAGADAAARFEREARAVAALSHPNIIAIHDVGNSEGIAFAVMELLEGATLRERVVESKPALARALEWAHQIAQGLSAAHERGVIHRDLKPDNIFVTRDGVVKILDFGLARIDGESPFGSDARTLEATKSGMVLGSVGYLSPEQARGATADHRSDIFAFGAVLYEMLAGEPAFLRGTVADSIVAILSDEPRPLSDLGKVVPAEVQEIVAHCLEKNRDERFRSARDLAFALRLAMRAPVSNSDAVSRSTPRAGTLTPQPRRTETSVAVLPFRAIGGSGESEYFADGMTEEIINSISKIATLHVAARTSSFAFRNRDDDVRKIGQQLGVAMVLEGSVRQVGSRFRVSAQLIAVDTGYQVWSERWDRDLADIFAVQDEIAQAIAATFKLRVGENTEESEAGTSNVEAWDRFLKGKYLLGRRQAAEAIAEFQAAIDIDPDFAEAHTALADGWAIRGYYGGVSTWEAWARASAAVDEAERSTPDAAGVWLSRALIQHYYGWNVALQEECAKRAIERSPRSAEGWNWYGICLASQGRTADALQATARGIELEPYHANVRTSAAWAHIFVADYEAGERTVRKALEFDQHASYALWTHAIALRCLGRYDESIATLERLVERSQRKLPFFVALLAASRAAAGDRAAAEEILHELLTKKAAGAEFIASLDIATALSSLRDESGALDALERARDERNALLWARLYFPDHIWLRTHPRWKALAARLGRSAPVQIV